MVDNIDKDQSDNIDAVFSSGKRVQYNLGRISTNASLSRIKTVRKLTNLDHSRDFTGDRPISQTPS